MEGSGHIRMCMLTCHIPVTLSDQGQAAYSLWGQVFIKCEVLDFQNAITIYIC